MDETSVKVSERKQNLNFRKLPFPDNLLATLLGEDDTEYKYDLPYDHAKLKQYILIAYMWCSKLLHHLLHHYLYTNVEI